MAATVEQLRARGATVSEAVSEAWGIYATIDGPDGHKVQFHQRDSRS